jgi:hypothetical protein
MWCGWSLRSRNTKASGSLNCKFLPVGPMLMACHAPLLFLVDGRLSAVLALSTICGRCAAERSHLCSLVTGRLKPPVQTTERRLVRNMGEHLTLGLVSRTSLYWLGTYTPNNIILGSLSQGLVPLLGHPPSPSLRLASIIVYFVHRNRCLPLAVSSNSFIVLFFL